MLNIQNLKKGDEVYWTDPDSGACSGIYKILEIKSHEILVLTNNEGTSYIEVFLHELS